MELATKTYMLSTAIAVATVLRSQTFEIDDIEVKREFAGRRGSREIQTLVLKSDGQTLRATLSDIHHSMHGHRSRFAVGDHVVLPGSATSGSIVVSGLTIRHAH